MPHSSSLLALLPDQALAWLLTYALHSTLLLALAWAVSRRLGGRWLRLEEIVWRCALIGGLLTATVQGAVGHYGAVLPGSRWALLSPTPQASPACAVVPRPGVGVPSAGGVIEAAVVTGASAGAGPRRAASAPPSGPSAEPLAGGVRRAIDAELGFARAVSADGGLAAGRAPAARTAGGSAAAGIADPARMAAGDGRCTNVAAMPRAGTGAADLEPRLRKLAGVAPGGEALLSGSGHGTLRPGPAGAAGAALRRVLAVAVWPTVALWLGGALLLTAFYARSYLLLRRRLRYRPQVVGGGVVRRLAALARAAGLSRRVRLTCTWRLRIPVALGTGAGEVCVPPRALFQLSEEQQDAMLAHELAHLARRDPLWLLTLHLIVSVFFFQPLNWIARRRLRDLSELLADEWAVAQTGRPLSLAGCLAEVAGWALLAGPPAGPRADRMRSLAVPGMADRPSQLAHRIRRLLEPKPTQGTPSRPGVAILLAAILAAVALAAPGVSADPGSAPTVVIKSSDAASTAIDAAPGPAPLTAPAAFAASASAAAPATSTASPATAASSAPTAPPPAPGAAAAPDPKASPKARRRKPTNLPEAEARLAEVDARLAALDHMSAMSEEQIDEMAATVDRMMQHIDVDLQKDLKDLTRRAADSAAGAPAPLSARDLADLDAQLAALTARIQPSAKDMAALQASLRKLAAAPPQLSPADIQRLRDEVERSTHQLAAVGLSPADIEKIRTQARESIAAAASAPALSAAERDKLIAEAHRLAEQTRPDAAQLKALHDLAKHHEDLARTLDKERAELETMRREIEQQAQSFRDLARRQAEDTRRSVPPPPQPPPPPSAPPSHP